MSFPFTLAILSIARQKKKAELISRQSSGKLFEKEKCLLHIYSERIILPEMMSITVGFLVFMVMPSLQVDVANLDSTKVLKDFLLINLFSLIWTQESGHNIRVVLLGKFPDL